MKNSKRSVFLKTVIFFVLFLGINACNTTRNIRLSKRDIRNLKVTYECYHDYKLFGIKWVFFEKNIVQQTDDSPFLRKTYTGTWSKEKNIITINFFYAGNYPKEKSFYLHEENNELEELKDSN